MLDLYHDGTSANRFHRYFNDFNNVGTAAFELSNLATEINYDGTTVNYGFDNCGNMVTEGSSRSFEWDYGDRMRGFAEGGVHAAYIYDSGGNRVKKIVTKSGANTEVTVYIDGGFEYLYEIDGSGAVTQEITEIHVMDGRSRVARVKVFGSTWSGSTFDAARYNLEDHLGNAGFTLDATGSLINREEYFPFGETSFGSYAIKRYRFCGKERDEESGLYYYGARYYACWSCRFVSIDPLAAKYPFYTPYQYAGNKPIAGIDLDGLENVADPYMASVAGAHQGEMTSGQRDATKTIASTTAWQQRIEVSNAANEAGSKADFEKANENLGMPSYTKSGPVRNAATGQKEGQDQFAEGALTLLSGPPGQIYRLYSAVEDILQKDDPSALGGILKGYYGEPINGIERGIGAAGVLLSGDTHEVNSLLSFESLNFGANTAGLGLGFLKSSSPMKPGAGSLGKSSSGSSGYYEKFRNINSGGFENNCPSTAIATELTMQGKSVSAMDLMPMRPNELINAAEGCGVQFLKREFRIGVQSPIGLAKEMLSFGEGARAIVHGEHLHGKTAHYFNAEVMGGKVYFPDGQSGGRASLTGFSRFNIFRTF